MIVNFARRAHNHNWELQPKDGATTALELIFSEAEGSPLTWQADVAWLVRGGAAPEPAACDCQLRHERSGLHRICGQAV